MATVSIDKGSIDGSHVPWSGTTFTQMHLESVNCIHSISLNGALTLIDFSGRRRRRRRLHGSRATLTKTAAKSWNTRASGCRNFRRLAALFLYPDRHLPPLRAPRPPSHFQFPPRFPFPASGCLVPLALPKAARCTLVCVHSLPDEEAFHSRKEKSWLRGLHHCARFYLCETECLDYNA